MGRGGLTCFDIPTFVWWWSQFLATTTERKICTITILQLERKFHYSLFLKLACSQGSPNKLCSTPNVLFALYIIYLLTSYGLLSQCQGALDFQTNDYKYKHSEIFRLTMRMFPLGTSESATWNDLVEYFTYTCSFYSGHFFLVHTHTHVGWGERQSGIEPMSWYMCPPRFSNWAMIGDIVVIFIN